MGVYRLRRFGAAWEKQAAGVGCLKTRKKLNAKTQKTVSAPALALAA